MEDRKSILKDDTKTVPLMLKGDGDQSLARRRVSFAPEVTLHKIDLIPVLDERRRETIGHVPGGHDVGHDVLTDSSDEECVGEGVAEAEVVDGGEDVTVTQNGGGAPHTTEQLLKQLEERPEEQVEEQLMELTKHAGNGIVEREETMEFTAHVAPSPVQTEQPITEQQAEDVEQTMELTTALPPLPVLEANEQIEETMELTGLVGTYTETTEAAGPAPPLTSSDAESDDGMELTETPTVNAVTMEVTMEVTEYAPAAPEEVAVEAVESIGPESTENHLGEAVPESPSPTSPEFSDAVEHLDTINEETEPESQATVSDEVKEGEDETNGAVGAPDASGVAASQIGQEANGVNGSSAHFEAATEEPVAEVPTELSQPMELTQPASASQPMELTQEASNSQPMELTQPKRPAVESESPAKRQRVSEAEEEEPDEEEEGDPITLSDFLKDVGIQFYDDLDIGVDPANRISVNLSSLDPELIDYYKANCKLPLLEVLELSCRELTTKISQEKSQYEDIKNSALPESQNFFKEYYSSSFPEQLKLRSHIQLIKEYSRQQAKQVWYEWRIKLMENVLADLNANLQLLESDKAALLENIAIIDGSFDAIREQHAQLKSELAATLQVHERLNGFDVSQIKDFRTRLVEINEELSQHQKKIAESNAALDEINSVIAAREAEIADCKKRIDTLDADLNDRKHYSSRDIEVLSMKHQLVEAASGCRYVSHTDSVISLEAFGVFAAAIDLETSTITFDLLEKNALRFKGLAPAALRLATLVSSPDLSAADTIGSLRRSWKHFAQLDEELYRVSLRNPVTLELSGNTVTASVLVYTPEHDLKVNIEVKVDLTNIPSASATCQVLRPTTLDDAAIRATLPAWQNVTVDR